VYYEIWWKGKTVQKKWLTTETLPLLLLGIDKVANLVVPEGVEEMQGSTYMCRFLRFEHC
jgi:hypothetical protein